MEVDNKVQHPYFPPGVDIPGFVPKDLPTSTILAIFTTTIGAVLLSTYHLASRHGHKKLSAGDVAVVLWFAVCGVIHLGLEGHFALHAHNIASLSDPLSQAWKEYSLSDSRYLTYDNFVFCMETVTAVCWGPLSFLCAYLAAVDSSWRWPLQTIISLGQLYGDVLYYATCTFEQVVHGREYSRPERYYFWGYYVFLNAIWIIIPAVLLVQSGRATKKAFDCLREREIIQNGASKVVKRR